MGIELKSGLEIHQQLDTKKLFCRCPSKLTEDIISESKKLVECLGLPIVQAPSEAEAQAAHIVGKGNAFAAVSQDYDSLIHGSLKLVRNLSISGKRKKTDTISYTTVKPEMIDLAENLNNLGIDQNQLIALAMLIGTDYNPGGIKGIGPKTALKLVRKHRSLEKVFEEAGWEGEHSWKEIFDVIKNMPVTDKYELKWNRPDKKKVSELLCGKHDFSRERVEKTMDALLKNESQRKQQSLGSFI